ncbi:MAG: hypothetical protein J5784_00560 [Muribaculaceae bacterium]|nr:hypothetical protein [Muribaculaceae bacterium]MBP5315918.1 hypothetical protein [Muribaculaceae bacterium]MBR4722370.1 hypothetical protein [Muribaculaceae bacterium]MBR5437087.1 hypothetical protein [Muribaculaceae bacterium]
MKKSSTSTSSMQTTVEPKEMCSPSKFSIELIRQFARSYHYESRLGNKLGNLIVN